jgi:hypothetical protein
LVPHTPARTIAAMRRPEIQNPDDAVMPLLLNLE